MDLTKIEAIIFDLGGVIVDLSPEKTIQSFAILSGLPANRVKQYYGEHPAFFNFETGKIDETTFRAEMRNLFISSAVEDQVIDDAWNAMLLAIPQAKLDLLSRLKDKYRIFILSNTNTIHVRHMHEIMLPGTCGARSFDSFVHQVYYSHEVGLRKPDPKIYQHVLDNHDLTAASTLFLDDNPDNIKGAQEIGMKAILVEHPEIVVDIFKHV